MVSIFVRRVLAYIADFFVVSAFMWIVSFILFYIANPYNMFAIYSYFVYVIPILIMVYFVICEKLKGATIGDALLYLQVRQYNGDYITWKQAIIRNLTKIYWFPIIFDWALGKILKKDDRILDVVTKTLVIDEV